MRIFTGFKEIFCQIFYPLIIACLTLTAGCNLKVKYLPQIAAPYVTEVEFLKQAVPGDQDIKKIFFEDGKIRIPFYVFIKIENIENSGQLQAFFYRETEVCFFEYGKRVIHMAGDFLLWHINRTTGVPPTDAGQDKKRGFFLTPGFWQFIPSFVSGCFKSLAVAFHHPVIFNLRHFTHRYHKKEKELNFRFGEDGKYYEHIIFLDKINDLNPGEYRLGVFLNRDLIHGKAFSIYE